MVAGARHEISIRYDWHIKQQRTRCHPLSFIRLRELERVFRSRYGPTLPDDDAGRDDLILAAHHIAQRGGDVVKHIACWASLWAPWIPQCEAKALAEYVAVRPLRFKAATLGFRLGLMDSERTALRIKTIRALGVTDEMMAERRRRADRERKAKWRTLKRLTKPETITRRKPWLAKAMSRATWYRQRNAPNKKTSETKSVRSKEKNIAADRNCLSGLASSFYYGP
jgi:hypothetical protein